MSNFKEFEYLYEIKKSKFYSYCFEIHSRSEFENILKRLKQEHKKARHICYAYNFINEKGILEIKYFDDGEPKGTAGIPIYSIIEKNNLKNTVIFVVRYFGGVKLGSGPLLRSYIKAAQLSINNKK